VGKPESAVVLMGDLLLWLEVVHIWRRQRECPLPKQEKQERSENERRQEDDQLDQGSMVVTHAHTTHQD
jgi:hypothetical protein